MNEKTGLLFITERSDTLETLTRLFANRYTVYSANTVTEALHTVRNGNIQIIVVDDHITDDPVIEIVEKIGLMCPDCVSIVVATMDSLALVNDQFRLLRCSKNPLDINEIEHLVDSAAHMLQSDLTSTYNAPDKAQTDNAPGYMAELPTGDQGSLKDADFSARLRRVLLRQLP